MTSAATDARRPLDSDVEAQQDVMIQFMDDVLASIGGRESCSDAEKALGRRIGDAWERLGYEVRREPFACHPHAFLAGIPLGAWMYLVAVVVYQFQPVAGGAISLLGTLVVFLQSLNYRRLLDPLFPRRQGENVAAVVRSRGKRQRRVIVNAHLDSAYEFTLWYRLGNWASALMVCAVLATLVPVVGAVLAMAGWPGVTVLGWASVACLPVVLPLWFWRSRDAVPGAMDDLAGVAVLIGLGEVLAREGGLESTDVVLLGTSSEEAGLRGAMRWAEMHRQDYAQFPTLAIVVDGVCDERHLQAVERELLAFSRFDRQLVDLACRVAGERGLSIRRGMIPLGATDATAFTRNGVPSVPLLAQRTDKLTPNYHTRHDTLAHVRPQSLTYVLQVVKDMLTELDKGR